MVVRRLEGLVCLSLSVRLYSLCVSLLLSPRLSLCTLFRPLVLPFCVACPTPSRIATSFSLALTCPFFGPSSFTISTRENVQDETTLRVPAACSETRRA